MLAPSLDQRGLRIPEALAGGRAVAVGLPVGFAADGSACVVGAGGFVVVSGADPG